MYVMKCYRQSNTIRVTMNRSLRYALSIMPGDLLGAVVTTPGTIEVRNLSADERTKPKRGKKS
jgi:hypothetical protein